MKCTFTRCHRKAQYKGHCWCHFRLLENNWYRYVAELHDTDRQDPVKFLEDIKVTIEV